MAKIQQVWQRLATATRVMNTEIRKEIIKQNAVDTGRMRNTSKIINLKWDERTDNVTMDINSTDYYDSVDVGYSRKYKGGKLPRNITAAFMAREKVIDQMDKLISVIFDYRIDQQFNKIKI